MERKGKQKRRGEKIESTPSDAAGIEDLTMEELASGEDKDVSGGSADAAEEKKRPVRRSGRVSGRKVTYVDKGADEGMKS